MFAVPHSPVQTKFLETLVFTLYNYGGNQREEFLLLKLFKYVYAILARKELFSI